MPPLSPRGRMHSFTNTTSSSEYDGSVVGDIRAEAAERALFERMVRDADEQAKKARAGLQELDRRESEEAAARTRRESEEAEARTRRDDERRPRLCELPLTLVETHHLGPPAKDERAYKVLVRV